MSQDSLITWNKYFADKLTGYKPPEVALGGKPRHLLPTAGTSATQWLHKTALLSGFIRGEKQTLLSLFHSWEVWEVPLDSSMG